MAGLGPREWYDHASTAKLPLILPKKAILTIRSELKIFGVYSLALVLLND